MPPNLVLYIVVNQSDNKTKMTPKEEHTQKLHTFFSGNVLKEKHDGIMEGHPLILIWKQNTIKWNGGKSTMLQTPTCWRKWIGARTCVGSTIRYVLRYWKNETRNYDRYSVMRMRIPLSISLSCATLASISGLASASLPTLIGWYWTKHLSPLGMTAS